MQNQAFETKRTPEGTIDVRHYARKASAERNEAKAAVIRALGHGTRRAVVTIATLFTFWNIPPMGSAGSKEMPYR